MRWAYKPGLPTWSTNQSRDDYSNVILRRTALKRYRITADGRPTLGWLWCLDQRFYLVAVEADEDINEPGVGNAELIID